MKITAKQYAKALLEAVIENKGREKEIADNFVIFLKERGQFSKWPEIEGVFERLFRKKMNIEKLEIISSHPLSADVSKKLTQKAIALSGAQGIEAEFSVNKGILGGFIMRYGDKVLDFSLRNKISKLKEDLAG